MAVSHFMTKKNSMSAEATKAILAALVRYALIALFGFLVKAGYVTTDDLTTAVPIVVGAILVVASMAWRKIKTLARIDAARELPANSTTDQIKSRASANLADIAPITRVLP